jgi:hypothetical protein
MARGTAFLLPFWGVRALLRFVFRGAEQWGVCSPTTERGLVYLVKKFGFDLALFVLFDNLCLIID